ncbi:UDP-N-acetylmuramate:L-alanyl-gamma-D-glutamyl-meso-diaminopimelate ligase [Neptunomonas antarctica]|uniref:UDP-N-acetylmuramate--L-alanyl-gamma-D-glutamyl-meso-2,6-diaminoheptandioate ligase n=1 Tax=Neptunomonas antarctica TaxID=619304 RepID=A0A1N7MVN2_9GAMM|nr:UDP-N-acetylmuramate:L-alanyl-gamma-D-glutamyl-meso-diaminopimelate ligase [Neptunomonas antarctica]SIS89919.1 UDP-N-acetylmuramate: L-alanyl-gamma-D-glutamyl-meso-diaminopimelate ligase [Neptunomonas antarctica]
MHIHILGICGTFMGSLALLARELGYRVTGSDANVYPPMSTQLEAQGIGLMEGYSPDHLNPEPDLVIIGNAMSRGNPAVEYVLDKGLRYTSGPQWLCEHVLQERWVLAVAGTHGKTTTASMLAWVLEYAGMQPGYLIGGVPNNFDVSARLGGSPFFVIEADEYDTAFFDKRSKFVHYRPRTLVLNNLEFDHADIFPDLAAIQRQFHHVVRTVPANGQVIIPQHDKAISEVIEMGCWTPVVTASIGDGGEWSAQLASEDGSAFDILHQGKNLGQVKWNMTGQHNVANGLMALIAARHVGVQPHHAIEALSVFGGVKRRMEKVGEVAGVSVYDDFAHHPTAIATTLQGLRAQVGSDTIVAIIEPRSNTMRLGAHRAALAESAKLADEVIWYQPVGLEWSLDDIVHGHEDKMRVVTTIDNILASIKASVVPRTHLVVMSNGGFEGIHQRLVSVLEDKFNEEKSHA